MSFASSVISTLYPSPSIRKNKPLSSPLMIWRIALISSWSKVMISSRRFRNSGENCLLSAFCMILRAYSLSLSSDASPIPAPAAVKPTPRAKSFNCRVPALLVIMITVLRKSTVRPLPSVRRPSSNTCSNILNTLPWAFSISSSSTTE